MKSLFEKALGAEKVVSDSLALASYNDDFSEIDGAIPTLAVLPTCPEDVQTIVRIAAENRLSLVPRVAGSNVSGLTIPDPNGVVVDLRNMNRVVSLNADDMVAVLEPGVTQQQLKDYLDNNNIPLTIGYSLGPTRSSVLANCCLDGLTNRSLKYGSMGEWVAGFEVVLADGSLIKTGAWALSDIPFAKSPFPDLSGLFIGWQGTTGIVTKVAIHLVPKHKFTERLFILTYSTHGTFEAMRRLSKLEICDDIGGLSWPTGKMILGVDHPFPVPEDGEPRFFLYVDLTGETHEEISYKKNCLSDVIADLRKEGELFEDPLDIPTLVALSPPMSKFASFPTDLEFLTDHPGGGLTWIGTYGPLSRFDEAAEAGIAAMVRHGFAPAIVSRSMKGGHFAVLRFLAIFDKKNPEEIARIRAMNLELLHIVTERGFVMYKTPAWALKELLPKMDPGFIELMRKVKLMLDPNGVFNPGRLLLS